MYGNLERFPHLNNTFYLVFSAWFDSDLLPSSDAEIINLAGICASDLHNKKQNLEGMADDLTRMLASWQSRDAMPFINASNTDWLFDDEMEQLLLKVLRQVVADLRYFVEQDKKALVTQAP